MQHQTSPEVVVVGYYYQLYRLHLLYSLCRSYVGLLHSARLSLAHVRACRLRIAHAYEIVTSCSVCIICIIVQLSLFY